MEKSLAQKHACKRGNEVVLTPADFKDGQLSATGYSRLKQECEYIGYDEDIEIIVPGKYEAAFKDTFEVMAANELSHIRKDKLETRIKAVVFLFIGTLWFTLGQLFARTSMIKEITLVATWVFVWTAVEKFFFDRGRLQERRFSLLQILSANVKSDENGENIDAGAC